MSSIPTSTISTISSVTPPPLPKTLTFAFDPFPKPNPTIRFTFRDSSPSPDVSGEAIFGIVFAAIIFITVIACSMGKKDRIKEEIQRRREIRSTQVLELEEVLPVYTPPSAPSGPVYQASTRASSPPPRVETMTVRQLERIDGTAIEAISKSPANPSYV
ncbi:hypothetical protein BC829DRAFT_494184 [Chytridium lagenaria]|nr:hypothetical protein BC829DRAFT_494184 [Chytridium lagenaria]